ncbi:hypothetical protein BgiBS90_033455, partial [Biomphalaria glabrata]
HRNKFQKKSEYKLISEVVTVLTRWMTLIPARARNSDNKVSRRHAKSVTANQQTPLSERHVMVPVGHRMREKSGALVGQPDTERNFRIT